MQVTFDLPEELAALLGENSSSLPRAALEALALEGVRSGKLTVAQARRLLGIDSRYEMDGLLKTHGIFLTTTPDEIERDADTALAFRNR